MGPLPEQPEINVGTAGHVDHGKTTILEALTGVWTSRHSEELRRGITIKIGYVDMPIYECTSMEGSERFSTDDEIEGCEGEVEFRRAVSFVDCPGHESLMANMLSGAAVMDGAVLVVAANEEVPRPQTKEHLSALEILGVDDLVVVQNKVDLVSQERAEENHEQIEEFLEGTVAEGAPIVPMSAIHELGTEFLLEALETEIPTPSGDGGDLEMYVIRSFDINKPGTRYTELTGGVLGGSILTGELEVGDELEILPGHLEREDGVFEHQPLYADVESLSSHGLSLEKAHSGGLIGVQTDSDPALAKSDGLVGNVCGTPGSLPEVRYEMDMEPDLFDYVVGTDEQIEVDNISLNEPLRLNVGAGVTLGTVTDLGPDQIRVEVTKPVVADEGWRAAIARQVEGKWRLIGMGRVLS